jgi:hypothetical protein
MASYAIPPPPSHYYPEPFKSGRTLARLVMGFLLLNLALRLLGIVSLLWQIDLLNEIASGAQVATEAARANDDRQQLITALQSLVYIITTVFFLIWIYRAYRNLKPLRQYPAHSAGWSVGYFFIPFINLVRPHQIAQEIWQKSDPETVGVDSRVQPMYDSESKSALISGWWALWLFAQIGNWLALSFAERSQSANHLISESWGDLVADALLSLAAVTCVLVVRQIDDRQEERHRRLQMMSAPPDYNAPLMPGS